MREKIEHRIEMYNNVLQQCRDEFNKHNHHTSRSIELATECEIWLYWLNIINHNISKKESFIGTDVYKMKNSFTYNSLDFKTDSLNKIECKVLFTKELFDEFLDNYLNFVINRISEDINDCKLYSSTSKTSNLLEHLKFEHKKDILKFLKDIYDERKN